LIFVYNTSYSFQDEATFTMVQLVILHDTIMCILITILGLVFWWLVSAVVLFSVKPLFINEFLYAPGYDVTPKQQHYIFYYNLNETDEELDEVIK